VVLHASSSCLLVVCLTGRVCASCWRTRSVPRRCRGPARRLSLWESELWSCWCAWACLCWLSCAGVLCDSALWAVGTHLGPCVVARPASTWVGVALAGGRCGSRASVMAWSASAAGGGGERGGERGALHDPIVITIVADLHTKGTRRCNNPLAPYSKGNHATIKSQHAAPAEHAAHARAQLSRDLPHHSTPRQRDR